MTSKDGAPARTTLALCINAEFRGILAAREITGTRLAQVLGVRKEWLSRRLNGKVPMTVDDVERIALALDEDPKSLISAAVENHSDTKHCG